LTKTITSPENQTSQRRFAPKVIGEAEIADRFHLKSVIVFLKIRKTGATRASGPVWIAP